MSAAEIIEELPKLTEDELRAVARRLIELRSGQGDEVELLDALMLAGMAEMDRRESEDAETKS
ncbi:MAG: hypothetical protein HY043_11535 [Verrucomicrobia bacterium]|nr:hypothetical protein [Verrucomicrobiota bacterium]